MARAMGELPWLGRAPPQAFVPVSRGAPVDVWGLPLDAVAWLDRASDIASGRTLEGP
jgi:hypothetical protein